MSTKSNANKIFQFKVTLRDTWPRVWRRILVPGDYNFARFHLAVNESMGWFGCHNHQFTVFHPKTGQEIDIGPTGDISIEDDHIDDRSVKIFEYFPENGCKAVYEYDFGDGWIHDIVLEKILPYRHGSEYPRCTAGKRACPPEDCGGVPGFKELVKILKNPSDPEYEERVRWLEEVMELENYNPAEFDPKAVVFSRLL